MLLNNIDKPYHTTHQYHFVGQSLNRKLKKVLKIRGYHIPQTHTINLFISTSTRLCAA